MIKIRTFGDGAIPEDTVLEAAFIDHAGDARLNDNDALKYGSRWVFDGNFIVLIEEPDEEGYVLTIPVQHLIGLYEILDTLPEEVLMSAKLDKL